MLNPYVDKLLSVALAQTPNHRPQRLLAVKTYVKPYKNNLEIYWLELHSLRYQLQANAAHDVAILEMLY